MAGQVVGAPRPDGPRLAPAVAMHFARLRGDLPLAALDVILAVTAYASVLVLRFDGAVPSKYWQAFRMFVLAAVATHLLLNAAFGLYGKMWRHASVVEARRVLLSGAVATALLMVPFVVAQRLLPASVVPLGGALTILFTGAVRFQSRLFGFQRSTRPDRVTRILVVGAGEAGGSIVREMLRDPSLGLVPVALLDDDPQKQGRVLASIPIVGGIDVLAEAAERYDAEQVLLAIPSASGELVRRVVAATDEVNLQLKVLPSLSEMVHGTVSVRDVRDLQINDLLGREQIETDLAAVFAALHGRRVLITGAGGSIGSEIARQVARCEPASLVLLDHDETHLYDTVATLTAPSTEALADIRDRSRVKQIFDEHRPQVVFHAAALKHVPILEGHAAEAIRTNLVGSQNVIEAARRHDVERFVFISTDKAVKPTSVMGASKRLGEQLLLDRAPRGSSWCAVRFGNVLGSRGSVIPTFMRQIAAGGPVTITDERMTRFFMSITEAVALVLQASLFAGGGEVFMLDMGKPVRIVDLAERMIRLSGLRPGVDVKIHVTGLRPGEKLAEELHDQLESPFPTPHASIVRLHPPLIDHATLHGGVAELAELADYGAADVKDALHALVASAPEPFTLRVGEEDPAVARLRARGVEADSRRVRASDAGPSAAQSRGSTDSGVTSAAPLSS